MNFENPIVETEYSLQNKYKKHLLNHKDIYIFDLKNLIPIYSYYIKKSINIESWQAKHFLNNHLTNITNAYKQFDTKIIERMLIDEAEKVQSLSKGNMLPDSYLNYSVDNAIINYDTIKVKSNSTIRFLTNPYYEWQENEYENKRQLKSKLINQYLGNLKVNKNYQLIYDFICDHDCNNGAITKKSLASDLGFCRRTINNYLSKYLTLNELFNTVKKLSKSVKQQKTSLYNSNKLVKRAS